VSYSREDAEDFALRLADDLQKAGASIWLDQLELEPGKPWDIEIERALAACPRMLAILSPRSVSSASRYLANINRAHWRNYRICWTRLKSLPNEPRPSRNYLSSGPKAGLAATRPEMNFVASFQRLRRATRGDTSLSIFHWFTS